MVIQPAILQGQLCPTCPFVVLRQQFLLGDVTTVDSVTLKLQRGSDGPTGSLGIELWQDNGSNEPLPV